MAAQRQFYTSEWNFNNINMFFLNPPEITAECAIILLLFELNRAPVDKVIAWIIILIGKGGGGIQYKI